MATKRTQNVIAAPSFGVEDGMLVCRLPLAENPVRSKKRTGKDGKETGGQNLILASSGGFANTGLSHNGQPIRANVTAICAAD